jgi:HPt (histidine-containing phosphotransfer) domain-containing protein
MFSICDDIQQTDLLRSWVEELTAFTPQQVETVIQQIQESDLERVASAA